MKRVWILGGLVFLAALVLAQTSMTFATVNAVPTVSPSGMTTASQAAGTMSVESQRGFAEQYCGSCHDDDLRTGDFSLSDIDLAQPDQNAELAEEIILKLRGGMMPPAGMPRPDWDTVQSFVSALEGNIDRVALAEPNPGRPALYRLNRTEYSNSIRDLLELDIDVESLLPADNMTYGFDNIADVLTSNPTLMESYVRAAGKISRLAVGDAAMSSTVEPYKIPTTFSQLRHVEGTPFGTRGGMAIVHNFPADAEYVFRMTLYFTRNTFLFGSTGEGEQLEVTVNGERVGLFDINPLLLAGENDFRTDPVRVEAGPQRVTASFITKADGPIDDFMHQPERSLRDDFLGQAFGVTTLVHLADLVIEGPHNATGVSDMPSRRKILVCQPATPDEEEPCARRIVTTLAQQAFRKPLTGEHLEELMAAYYDGRGLGDFDSGIRLAVQFILANPEFVFRFERAPAGVAPGAAYPISDLELASRLSHFLWSSTPDDELVSVAGEGRLSDPAVLEQQVRRMLADPRADSLATSFAVQWLLLRSLRDVLPDVYLYPDSDENLFESMRRETELLFDNIVREDRSVLELLTANYTFVDERLAKHYGIPNVLGSRFRRVTLTDENRFGLLGHGGILTVTSFSNRTSPVVRGKWILEQILGVPPPIPPPVVPELEENNVVGGDAVRLQSVRERLEKHRMVEPCASCHKIIDPIGMALENFDAIGVWRDHDSGFPVDPSAELVDGTKVDSPVSLRQALLKYEGSIVRNFIVRLTTYALGRGVTHVDMPVIRQIEREAAGNDYRFTSIVMGIVESPPFRLKRAESPTVDAAGLDAAAGGAP